ncbi:hypothetical protein O3M35_003354 [Rhynocoris fuscipes]|uniref:Uncharacterized protein n=1 Tax=Rhynocoris fuscipes TaxID=488301 RepID=A0AAW1CK32_9HEMI
MASTSDSSEKSKTDDSIDPLSTKFDPLTALYSKESKVPCVNAPILDNICKFVIDQKTGDIEIVNKKEVLMKVYFCVLCYKFN